MKSMTFEQARAKALAAGATDEDIDAEASCKLARRHRSVPQHDQGPAASAPPQFCGGLDTACSGAQSKEGVETMSRIQLIDGVAFIRADQVIIGDRLDLEGDQFADPNGDGMQGR
jgi:hypothetical protein